MDIQHFAYAIEDAGTPVIIESEETGEQVEICAYMLRRMLYTAEKLSADNIKLTVKKDAFEDIKFMVNKTS